MSKNRLLNAHARLKVSAFFGCAILMLVNPMVERVRAAEAVLNQLTDSEKAAGWRLLFDGKTTEGWRSFKKETFPKQGWVVEDGVLTKVAGVRGGDIITDA